MTGKTHGDGLTRDAIRAGLDCPRCDVIPGAVCDRGGDWWLSPADRAELQSGGANHYERMLAAYGHSPAMAVQIAERHRSGGTMRELPQQAHPAVTEVVCPEHDMPRGVPCPRPAWPYCQARKARLVKAALRQQRHDRRRGSVVRISSCDRASAKENHWADTGPDECLDCFLASVGVLVGDHDCTGGPR
jgi:hypothetical protein